jgi:putative membrane protein
MLIAVSLAALSLTGCGDRAEPIGEASPSVAAADDIAVAPTTSPGQAFADAAAASDSFEIETSRLAATKAQAAKVKTFAEQMIKAHTESTAKLKTAADAATITPVARLTATQQQTLDALATKSGDEFDRAYAQAQRDAHQATLDALKSYSATGDVPSLKAFATELVPIVTAHLNMAKAL